MAPCGTEPDLDLRHSNFPSRCRKVEGIGCGTTMTSYIHTCDSCGLEMTVHERYFGRQLRCRECRTEFVAGPEGPAGEVVDGGRLPPEYCHTCTACGSQMTVYERYYGRRLRCTECGEEFDARVPAVVSPPSASEASPADSSPELPAPDPEQRSRRRRHLAVATAALVATILLVLWLGGDRDEGFGSSLFKTEKGRTQIGVLDRGSADVVMVALERDGLDELMELSKDTAVPVPDELLSSPRYLQVATGTRVRVLERSRGGRTRVRVLDGPQNSRIVWVPLAWIQ